MNKHRFYYHCLRRNLTNFSFLRHMAFEGFIVSMHQSGTHWLKHMLGTAISHERDLPPPRYHHANEFICGPKYQRIYSPLPSVAHSHSVPHALLKTRIMHQLFKFPRYALLIRDIRPSLVSHYEKLKDKYQCDFSEFLKGDISGKRYSSDIWWCIRFLNSWGKIIENYPEQIIIVKYEELSDDTLHHLNRVNEFLNLDLSEDSILYGIAQSSKEIMKLKQDPRGNEGTIRMEKKRYCDMASEHDQSFFRSACKKFLKYDFGYDYH